MSDKTPDMLVVGKISGVYGVKGWVKVYSWTHPRENILSYPKWQIGRKDSLVEMSLIDGKAHGKGIIARLEDCDSREQAELLMGKEIFIHQGDLEQLDEGEYYWRDLIGLKVMNLEQQDLGVVKSLMETGANNVLVIKGENEHLVPWVMGQFVQEVDLEAGTMLVDWDPEF